MSPPWAIEGIFKQQMRGKSLGNPWETRGKTMENHDDMDMSLSELGTNPAVMTHIIMGTSTFQ